MKDDQSRGPPPDTHSPSSQYDSDTSIHPTSTDHHGPRSYRPFNRGNKLKRSIEQPGTVPEKPTLCSVHAIDEEYEFAHVGKRRAILKKARRRRDEDDPYAGINIEEIWSLPDSPTDLSRVSSVLHALKDRHLKILSQSAMAMVEREQEFNKTIARFAAIIQMDDPMVQDVGFEEGLPGEVLKGLREGVQELVSCSNEYVKRIGDMRDKLIMAHVQKKRLAKKLLSAAAADSTQHQQQQPLMMTPVPMPATGAARGAGGGRHSMSGPGRR
ncbi:hypothetical protein DFS34DRAFT_288398 [Phlyctochytrium arcticum]|nr:hypothetical protein DFS34DRAFT_288398 [Phlyctochytrium arcticum]